MKMYILNQTVADFTHIHYGDPMLQKVEVEEKWLPPPRGWLKVNTYATFRD